MDTQTIQNIVGGAVILGCVSLLFYFVKKYFDLRKEMSDKVEKRQDDLAGKYTDLTLALNGIELLCTSMKSAIDRIETDCRELKTAIARNEGSIEFIRKDVADNTKQLVVTTSKLEALFRIADAPRRASDVDCS